MSKQHTFKSTKETEWIDEILNAHVGVNKSNFIREMVIRGLMQIGHQPPDPYAKLRQQKVIQESQKVLQEPQKVTQVTPKETQEVTPAIEAVDPPINEEIDTPSIVIEDVDMDFDAALRAMNDNFS